MMMILCYNLNNTNDSNHNHNSQQQQRQQRRMISTSSSCCNRNRNCFYNNNNNNYSEYHKTTSTNREQAIRRCCTATSIEYNENNNNNSNNNSNHIVHNKSTRRGIRSTTTTTTTLSLSVSQPNIPLFLFKLLILLQVLTRNNEYSSHDTVVSTAHAFSSSSSTVSSSSSSSLLVHHPPYSAMRVPVVLPTASSSTTIPRANGKFPLQSRRVSSSAIITALTGSLQQQATTLSSLSSSSLSLLSSSYESKQERDLWRYQQQHGMMERRQTQSLYDRERSNAISSSSLSSSLEMFLPTATLTITPPQLNRRSSWISTTTTTTTPTNDGVVTQQQQQSQQSLFYAPPILDDVGATTGTSSTTTTATTPPYSSTTSFSKQRLTSSSTILLSNNNNNQRRLRKYHRQRGVLGFQIHNVNDHHHHHGTTTTTFSSSTTIQNQQQQNDKGTAYYYNNNNNNNNCTTTTTMFHDNGSSSSNRNRRTRLQAATNNVISNVDAMSWNVPEPFLMTTMMMDDNDDDEKEEKKDNNIVVASESSSSSSSSSSSHHASLSDDTIDSLTVVQLKSELGIRSLKKVGNKYLLQNRLKEYIIRSSSSNNNNSDLKKNDMNQQQQQQKSLSSLKNNDISRVSSFLEQELPSWGIDSSSLFIRPPPPPPLEQCYSEIQQSNNDEIDSITTTTTTTNDSRFDSLQEWARTVDLEPLLHRREAIHREKLVGPPKQQQQQHSSITATKQLPNDLRAVIQKMFDQPSSIYSNREVKQMYAAAKHADQIGDRLLSKRILYELKIATPNDARIYRRLARMELEDNNVDTARSVLLSGIQLHPENAYLWHGLGQLEGSVGNSTAQRMHWLKAIDVDPYVPHSYHALGTLDHTNGHVAQAMKILKKGVQYCPTNHRLHHALGDLYRDAKMLSLARISYKKAIQHGPPISHGFAYTALSYVAYEEGNIDQCRHYLRKAVHLNNGRNANGWVALAQLEESEGNIDEARTACMVGIGQYERGLIEQSRRTIQQQQQQLMTDRNSADNSSGKQPTLSLSENPVTLRNKILQTIPIYRSGDRFYNVYRNWLRLEQRYGTIDSVEEVYERAIVAFPNEYKIMMDVAQYFVRLNLYQRARAVYTTACCIRTNHKTRNTVHADPYRLFAEFEMQLCNYDKAQKILYSGVMTLSKFVSSPVSTYRLGLPQLFLTWAVCEWHLNNLSHAEKLFDYALRLTSCPTSEEFPKFQSMLLYSIALFEYNRKNLRRAQHYIGLSLKENALPGGNAIVWDLWATIAYEMGNIKLAHQCQERSTLVRATEQQQLHDGVTYDYNNRLLDDNVHTLADTLKRSKSTTTNHRSDLCQLLRRDPWHTKIFGSTNENNGNKNDFLNIGQLPQNGNRSKGKVNKKDKVMTKF